MAGLDVVHDYSLVLSVKPVKCCPILDSLENTKDIRPGNAASAYASDDLSDTFDDVSHSIIVQQRKPRCQDIEALRVGLPQTVNAASASTHHARMWMLNVIRMGVEVEGNVRVSNEKVFELVAG